MMGSLCRQVLNLLIFVQILTFLYTNQEKRSRILFPDKKLALQNSPQYAGSPHPFFSLLSKIGLRENIIVVNAIESLKK